jgi:Zn-finger nucleic acid-binding protein
MSSTLNCPTCGAAADGVNASRCAYCGSTLTSVACPACFGAMFAGMDFCPHCGAKGARSVDTGTTLPCPACKAQMRSVEVGDTALFECGGCSGMWVDPATFGQLCASREARGAVAAMVGGVAAKPAAILGGPVHYLPCPRCAKFMNRQNFGHVSGLIVSVCKGDGVWFEKGELQSVMAFVDGGGLERGKAHDAQLRQADHQLEQLRAAGPPSELSVSIAFTSDPARSSNSIIDDVLKKLFS